MAIPKFLDSGEALVHVTRSAEHDYTSLGVGIGALSAIFFRLFLNSPAGFIGTAAAVAIGGIIGAGADALSRKRSSDSR